MVVTNEEYIARAQVTNLLDYDDFSIISSRSFELSDGIVNSTVSVWQEINTEETITKFIALNDCSNTYNVIFVPISGLLFTIAKDRANNNTVDRYVIVSFKERFQSYLVDKGLYNIYADSRRRLTPVMIRETFEAMTSNILLSSEYNQLIMLAKTLYTKPNHALITDKILLYLEMTNQ